MLESSKIPKDSSLSRREIRRDKRRTRIRDAAFELFERQGFEATTIDQIAALADVGKGTFFNYFPTKQNVLTDYYTRLSAEFINNAENIKTGNAQKRFAFPSCAVFCPTSSQPLCASCNIRHKVVGCGVL
jgi:AcrR family transcriptional regulator